MHNLQRLFEYSRDLMCVASTDGYFREVNPAFRKLLGYSEAELTEVPFLDLVHPADRAATLAEMDKLKLGQPVLRFENRYRCKSGAFKWLAWVATPQLDENLIYAVARDVTDSKQSLDDLMSDLPGMVYRCLNDAGWTMNFVSRGCFELSGYHVEDLLSSQTISWNEVVHPEDRARLHREVQSAINERGEFQLEYRIVTSSGAEKTVWEKGRAIYDSTGGRTLQGYVLDITDRRKMQDELAQLQRMESLGQLTGGVAHDFNNLLAIITGNLQLLETRVAHDGDASELVQDALEAAWRGAELCQRLLAFGRRQMLQPEPTAVNELVNRVEKLVRLSVGDGIDIDLSLAADLPEVLVDQGQLENAILNLAINARDAMPDGGFLFVRTDRFRVDTAYAELHPEAAPGEYVVIEIGDSGSGMPPAVLERACEPFFTTKEQGKGTGLGLSMVYGLLKQSGGHVRIYSEVGHGTSVKLYLPVPAAPPLDVTDALRTLAPERPPGGSERILVVEDDAGVRKMVVRMLGELGYQTVAAEDAAAALECLGRPQQNFDLLLTDVIMPGGMDGMALAKRATLDRPNLKILLTSGFSRHHLHDWGAFPMLNKPYHEEQLATMVRQVLDS